MTTTIELSSTRPRAQRPKFSTGVDQQTPNNVTTQDAPKPWVLCIDDDEDFTHALKLRLQTQGYDVARASHSKNGYQFAFEFEPIAILLDLNMPGESGEELLSQLRFHPETNHIPVMIITGMNQPGLETRLLSQGAHAFFRKPVSFNTLMDAIMQIG